MGTRIKAWLKTLWTKLNSDLKALWAKDKIFVIAFSAVILLVKSRQFLIDLIVSSSKALFTATQEKTNGLQKQENQDNDEANQLINKSNNVSNQEKPVTDDWYKP